MRVLFLHNNFPAQYLHLSQLLAADPDNTVVFGTKHTENVQLAGVHKVNFAPSREPTPNIHHYVRNYESAVLHGQAVYRLAEQLKASGFVPDVVSAHSGWGVGMFIKDAFPDAGYLAYCEWFGQAHGSDADFDPAFPMTPDDVLRIRAGNAPMLVDLYSCDRGLAPTLWQRDQFPPEFHSKISVLHDGVDTDYFFPDPAQKMLLINERGETILDLSEEEEIITYVSRGMDAYRGFPQFIQALGLVLERRPKAHVVIVAADRIAYGPAAPEGNSFKDYMLKQVPLDLSRVHFVGNLPYGLYKLVLRASSVHVYLTRPFVLSWSFMEAMASGCLIVASDTPPVREMMQDGINGLLVDFFAVERIGDRICDALEHRKDMQPIRDAARQTIVEHYAQKTLLPKHVELLRELTGS
ncbi:MAG: glycosyltransferase family 4 protein [Elainellaceae cyanobacterium]